MKYYLQIVSYFPSQKNFRGSFLLDQTKSIQKHLGMKVIVFKVVNFFSKEKDYIFDDVEVKIVKSIKIPSNLFPYLFQGVNKFLFKLKLRKLSVLQSEVSVIHCHDMHNCIYGYSLKKNNLSTKFFVQVHGLDVLEVKNGLFQNKLNRSHIIKNTSINCSITDTIIGVSELTIRQFIKYSEFDKFNYTILYNGVDFSKFHPKKTEPRNYFVIGCIANFIPIKDHLTLVKAVKRLKNLDNIKCKLIGTGPTLPEIKNYVLDNDLGEIVEFEESISHNRLVDYYNSIDIFVMPSYYESMGCVYLEAYTCNVPFVSVKDMGITELISEEDKQNWTIEPGDYHRLAEIILNFYYNRNYFKISREIDINKCINEFLIKLDVNTE